MTKEQYKDLFKIYGHKLTDKDLRDKGLSLVDGEFDEEAQETIRLFQEIDL